MLSSEGWQHLFPNYSLPRQGGGDPKKICLACFLGVVSSEPHQHPRQHQRHLRIIGWLPGKRFPCAAIGKLSNAMGILAANLLRRLKFDEAAQGISRKLTVQTSLSAGQASRVER
jgi:hypothetical protein